MTANAIKTEDEALAARFPIALDGGRLACVLPPGGTGLTDSELRATPVDVNIVSGGGGGGGGLTDTQLRATPVPVSGTVTTGGLTDTQLRAVAVPVSGTFWQATQPVSIAAPVPVTGTFWQATQPVSAASLPLPLGAATEATLATLATSAGISSVVTTLTNGTQHTIVDSLPAGLATGALQTTGNTSLSSIDTKTPALGQTTMAGSQPVAIASNQSAIPVTGTFFQATQPVSIAASVAVTGTFFQATQPVSAAALPLPTGASTETTLAAVSGKLPATLGQKAMAASMAVVVASDQSTLRTQHAVTNRVRATFTFQAVAPAVADTLLTISKNLGGTVTAATTHAVTAAKVLRITAVSFTIRAGAAAAAFGTVNIRVNGAGAAVIGSPSIMRLDVGNTAAVIGAADMIVVPIPDGLEFSGTSQIGVSLAAQAVTNIISITLIGYEYTP